MSLALTGILPTETLLEKASGETWITLPGRDNLAVLATRI